MTLRPIFRIVAMKVTNIQKSLLCVSFIILIHTGILACFFQDKTKSIKILTSSSKSILSSDKFQSADSDKSVDRAIKSNSKSASQLILTESINGGGVPALGLGETAESRSKKETSSELIFSAVNRIEADEDEEPDTVETLKLEEGTEYKQPTTAAVQPKMVLLMTQSRHGSTWLMDMLGYRHQTIPVFEPLNCPNFLKMYAVSEETREETLAAGYDPGKYSDWREVILARICLCDWYGVMIPGKEDRRYGSIRGLWYKAKQKSEDHSGPFDEFIARDLCKKADSIMIPKTIRYYNLSGLYKINEFGCEDFKIIHLVRDPRAVMNSRMTVFSELYDGNTYLGPRMEDLMRRQEGFDKSYVEKASDHLCSHHLENYKLGMNPPPWLKDRYKMVRYEDLAEFPQVWARELLHFIGVSYTAKYKEYVYNTTHVKDRGKKDGGYYGVERQSIEMLDKWKEKLIEPHWRTIEKVCAEMMKAFNYKPTFSDPED